MLRGEETRVGYLWRMLSVGAIVLACASCQMWNDYASPGFDPARADRLCHPYGDCVQGHWAPEASSEGHSELAYRSCEADLAKRHGPWVQQTVALRLEIQQCMKTHGFRLLR